MFAVIELPVLVTRYFESLCCFTFYESFGVATFVRILRCNVGYQSTTNSIKKKKHLRWC